MIAELIGMLVLAMVAAGGGEWHGRRVAYGRSTNALHGLVVQMEVLAGRWSARRVAAAVLRQAGMPARAAVLGADVALDEIEETDADRAFDPAQCPDGCEDCAEAVDEQRAAAGRDAETGREVIGLIRRAVPPADGGERS